MSLLTVIILLCATASAQQGWERSTITGRTHNNQTIDVDLPNDLHMKNIGSRVDNAGMCVMSSIEMASRWQNITSVYGIREYAAGFAGGASPPKVDQQIKAFFQKKGMQPPKYLQYEGPDPGLVIEAALRSGRMAAITYGYSHRYAPAREIYHMVNCVKYGNGMAVVLDNNFPGEDKYEWMSTEELVKRCKHPPFQGQSMGWVFIWLDPPPPPSPRNLGDVSPIMPSPNSPRPLPPVPPNNPDCPDCPRRP